jgi:hypothetical protein
MICAELSAVALLPELPAVAARRAPERVPAPALSRGCARPNRRAYGLPCGSPVGAPWRRLKAGKV